MIMIGVQGPENMTERTGSLPEDERFTRGQGEQLPVLDVHIMLIP